MNIREYETIKPIITFNCVANTTFFEYDEKLYDISDENISYLKEVLEIPYKLLFNNISVTKVMEIIEKLRDEETTIFVYREMDATSNKVNYCAYINNKEKVKKLD